MEENTLKNKSFFVKATYIEVITAVIIIISVVIIKYFFPVMFGNLTKWYEQNVLDETKVYEVWEEIK